MKPRAKFPQNGSVHSFRRGHEPASSYYLNEADEREFRYLMVAHPDSINRHTVIADCWLCNKYGAFNPGTMHSPVPIHRDAVGRRITV